MPNFELVSEYKPTGDQPKAIEELADNLARGVKHQVLMGVTGSGKTFTMANVVAKINKPTLVIAHNKTLAAQLYGEFKELFPNNAVGFFVSYYDYYQPEAYIPSTDTYIEKDASINEEIDQMRHFATYSLLSRQDVLIVASVSCIYGLGSPEAYYGLLIRLEKGKEIERDKVLRKLVEIQYERNDIDFHRGAFRVRGDTLEIFPAYEGEKALRVEFFGDKIEAINEIDPLRGKKIKEVEQAAIFPASHFVQYQENLERAIKLIQAELEERASELRRNNKLLEAERITQRTLYDIEMLRETGHCQGIENYSRPLSGRPAGEPPATLIDYFPKDFLLFIDESHMSVPQIGGMYRGDRSRKETLVQYGFRLPSALDNRPLTFEEFERRENQVTYVSATPADYEMKKSDGLVVEQIIRPTGLLDPEIEVRPAQGQVDDLLEEIRKRVEAKEKVLVTTLTKRMAEDLTTYYQDLGVRAKYMHSDIATLQRYELVKELRMDQFDVLVGINLLREGLDIPEVSLVAVLDADQEGFLRAEKALIQVSGRAARNLNGKVIFYGDRITKSMNICLKETTRRRKIQMEYNQKNGITPESIKKAVREIRESVYEKDYFTVPVPSEAPELDKIKDLGELDSIVKGLQKKMKEAADNLEFEKAAKYRDQIKQLWDLELSFGLRSAEGD
jgi:excinuclease ABC subunit B